MKKIFLVISFGLIVGCEEKKDDIQFCNDLIPCEVIVNDFIEIDKNGVNAVYKIVGRAQLKVNLEKPKYDGNEIIYTLSQPEVDDKGITFDPEKTKILSKERSIFTTLTGAEKVYRENRSEAVEVIKEVAKQEECIKMARIYTEGFLAEFHNRQNPDKKVEIKWGEK